MYGAGPRKLSVKRNFTVFIYSFIYLLIYFNFLIMYKLQIVGGMGPTVGMVSCHIIYLHPPISVIPVPDATLLNSRNTR